MSFVNELFERLSKSTTANDVQEALSSLGSIQDPSERVRAARETVILIEKYTSELLDRGQYKNAAYQLFSGSQLIQNFLLDSEAENQWLRSSADALAKASQEYTSWDDLIGGAACMVIASLLRIQTGDWDIKQHLDSFVQAHDFSADQAAAACLYIPYDLAGAVNPENPNPSLLHRASNYTESYLFNTKPAAMFVEGIKRTIELTRQKLMEVVKFPSIRAAYEFDHDVIFGEEFKFKVKIENTGEGVASSVVANIKIPSSITVVTGTNSISVSKLDTQARTETEFSLLCTTGEGKEEITVEIPVTVEYQDILMNKNSISLGSAQIVIRSEKQAQKLLDKLKPLENTILEEISPLKSLTVSDIQPLISSLDTILANISSTTKNNIQEGEFPAASIGLLQLERMQEFITPLVSFLNIYSEQTQKLLEDFQAVKTNSVQLVKSLKKIQEQLDS
ncbi:MAG: hypothetical protein ACXAC8_12705 [Candidatus Hodarchaeales archaeon]|jgi:hypothetical protein